jgi:hypothetical protein
LNLARCQMLNRPTGLAKLQIQINISVSLDLGNYKMCVINWNWKLPCTSGRLTIFTLMCGNTDSVDSYIRTCLVKPMLCHSLKLGNDDLLVAERK